MFISNRKTMFRMTIVLKIYNTNESTPTFAHNYIDNKVNCRCANIGVNTIQNKNPEDSHKKEKNRKVETGRKLGKL